MSYMRFSRGSGSDGSHVLPGEDLIEAGIRDLHDGRESIEALLVAIGAPRLRRLGIELPDQLPDNPEHRLYDLLSKDDSDSAHSRYNAYLRRLVSYERAAELLRGITLRDKLEEFLSHYYWEYEASKAGTSGGGRTHTFGLRNAAKKLKDAAVYQRRGVRIIGGKAVPANGD